MAALAGSRLVSSSPGIAATIGLLHDYPNGRVDTVELPSRVIPTDGWVPYPDTHRWIPDAFLGPVRSPFRAIAEGGEAETRGRDNLQTMRVSVALYWSGATTQVIPIEPRKGEVRP